MKQTTGRKIKFRAWDNEENKMYEFNLVTYMGTREDAQEDLCSPNAVNNIMQFTGLQDKNGKEIYEGDIMKAATGESVYEVIWLHSGWFRKPIKGTWGITSLFVGYKHQTVVGNIYENLNLLPK